MEQYQKELLKELRPKYKSYAEMISFCCENCLLNNEIVPELEKSGFYFDIFCGDLVEYHDENGNIITEEEAEESENSGIYYKEIYQYYIISARDAERLADYTDEIVMYNERLDLYILCVTHCGTAWSGVPANWKTIKD